MIDPKTIQNYLHGKGAYTGAIDGQLGLASLTAMNAVLTNTGVVTKNWTYARIRIGLEQLMMKSVSDVGEIDGISGPRYQYGLELYQNYLRDQDPPAVAVVDKSTQWPRQKDIEAFYGKPGANQVKMSTPYPLFLDWDQSVKINAFMIHTKCAESATRAMEKILSVYGPTQIHQLGLNQFGGCLNVRPMRGGTRMSMHSWGCAIDWDADRNSLRMDHKTAQLAKPEYQPFIDAWYTEGWIGLGRERDFDWMHVQAARL